MTLALEQAIGQKILLAFQGVDRVPDETLQAIRQYRPAGFTLFRAFNIETPQQVRQLTSTLQKAAREHGLPPFLIAADQEGGQLMAVGGATPLPGNLALGATGSVELSRQAGEVLGSELAAMGINVNYAPCCDVNVNPHNPVVGTRSFGEEPDLVASLSAAMVNGIQSAGVAATAKHFPGHGDTASDSHHAIPVLMHSLERLREVELPPFSASIRAGVKLVMSGHLALPALDGRTDLPATLSSAVLQRLLRGELGYEGVIVTDALDMGAIRQGEALGGEAVQAAVAGADLLLLNSVVDDQQRVYSSLTRALRDGRLDHSSVLASAARVLALKDWLSSQETSPDLSVVGCAAHRKVADQIASQAITLVRDLNGLLPLRMSSDQRIAVILPQPIDLTPADTSSYVIPRLAQALRQFHPYVREFVTPFAPLEADIAALLPQLTGCDLVIIGTINAFAVPGQAELVRTILRAGIPTIVAALRMPYDLAAFPEAPAYLCSYSILEPGMHALARALFGRAGFPGRLPVSIPDLYVAGHRWSEV